MRRSLALLAYAQSALSRRAGRSVALTLSLALTTAMSGSIFLVGSSLDATADALAEDMPALVVQRMLAGRPALLRHEDAERLRALPSVRRVSERVWGYLYQPALESNVVVYGLDASALVEAIGGDAPLDDDEVLVGSALGASLGLRAGDRLALVPASAPPSDEHAAIVVLRVRALLPEGAAMVHGDSVLASPSMARRLLGLAEGDVVDLALDVFPPEEAGVVASRVLERIAGARIIERDALTRRRTLTFDARAGLLSATLLPLLLAMLLMAFDRLSGLGDLERREIGILKAVGWSTRDVLTARMLESGIIASIGAGSGLLSAYAFVFLLGAPGLIDGYLGWSNLRPELVLVPTIDLDLVLFTLSLVTLPFVAVSVFPAWRAASVDPERAMRGSA